MTQMPQNLTYHGRSLDPSQPRRWWRDLSEYQSGRMHMLEQGEFAPGADLPPDGLTRRRFMQLMAASAALAGLQGCTQQPPEKIVPYVEQPEKIIPGKPIQYATAINHAGYGRGVLLTTYEGRPTKVEGNPDHPASGGATSVFDQAAVLGLYDPDRAKSVLHLGTSTTWNAFERAWADADIGDGSGLAILTGNFTSPTLLDQMHALLDQLPGAKWYVHEPARPAPALPVHPVYDLDKADIIVSLDSDFLDRDVDAIRLAMAFSRGRRVRQDHVEMNRLYVAEPVPTVTGAKADHRLPVHPRDIVRLAHALTSNGSSLPPEQQRWVDAALADLRSHRGRCLIVAGQTQPPIVHQLAAQLNASLGNVGQTVRYVQPFDAASNPRAAALGDLMNRIDDVQTLLILGCNPIHTAPADYDFARRMKHIPLRISHNDHVDETALQCHWHLPATHELEMWSDTRSADGMTALIQPMILPLYKGRSPHELLSMLLSQPRKPGHDILRDRWRKQIGEGVDNFDTWWRRTLKKGVVPDSTASAVSWSPSQNVTNNNTDTDEKHEGVDLCILPDARLWDGRYANNPWLQELPQPISKLVWGNAVLLSPATAAKYHVADERVVRLTFGQRSVEGPVWIVPGMADDLACIHLGFGRSHCGRVGDNVGFNTYALRTSDAPWGAPNVTLTPLDRSVELVTTQHHQQMEDRPLMRSADLDAFRQNPRLTAGPKPDNPEHTLMPEHDYSQGYKWGMVIDLTSCIGCGVCTIACQAENNIPVVGATEVSRGREMHWIRIDRYYEGDPHAPAIHHQPIPCMHCEHAPCEIVCPTGATQHSVEGLNEMIYNRCIGTRYCSNNCPYKVRRFNFFDYVDNDEPQVRYMQRNPNVTVRGRGVMEKCTYCVQRIEAARIDAMKDDRDIGPNEVTPACAAACPTQAITFGDLNNPKSHVYQLHHQPHQYGMLTELNTYPRTRYLTEIRNPSPNAKES